VSESELLLRATGLTIGYGGSPVLRDVDLEIGREQFWSVVGPNASGKTTLLRALLGLIPLQAGRLERHPEHARREAIAFVPQRSEFDPTLPTTVREFVLLGLAGIRVGRPEETERLAHALERTGLSGLERRDYRSLSGGQRQRALVARALARNPALLILDEATVGLDLVAEATLLRFLCEVHREERLSLIFVSHDLRVARNHATHVALLHGGTLEAGPAHAMLVPERLARAYGVALEGLEGDSLGAAACAAPERR
jgi:ABC-type Mn2+/Zn2+ transport system ATPase subunit